ncbi:serine--tRNA synthetase-like protein Slimp, partial [Diabrotica undecimpunctata]|uniref:serine--tRNA synthetase-like protein Slimp n=1 Tax=Diabrotica undecimpunctata TaxID=50387 RepID=UPI003B637C65
YFTSRYYSSALYITGEKAQKTFVVLTPVIDFEKHLINKSKLVKNIKVRGLKIDFDDVVKQWTFFQEVSKRKHLLELTRQDIAQNITNLLKKSDTDPSEVEKYKVHAKIVKDDLKNLKISFYDIEEATMLKVLSLPNDLHSQTPHNKETVLHTHLNQPKNDSLDHITIGTDNNFVKYLNPYTCYLKSDAALLELNLLGYFRKMLLEFGHFQFSNPNFCRTVIYDGCVEVDQSNKQVFDVLEHDHDEDNLNRLHLCGSGSLMSFMAYFARHALHQVALPLRYFSFGKVYQPIKDEEPPSFFNLSQQSVISIFNADLEDTVRNVDKVVSEICRIYNSLGFHYRIVILPACKIENSESLHISIQMYSNFKKEYVEVGNVCFYDSYVSKRLLFTYSLNKDKKYPKIISGSLINFHKFLACMLENIASENNINLKASLKKKFDEINNVC